MFGFELPSLQSFGDLMFEFSGFFDTYLPEYFLSVISPRLSKPEFFRVDYFENIFGAICDFFMYCNKVLRPTKAQSRILLTMDSHFKLEKTGLFQQSSTMEEQTNSKIAFILSKNITQANRFYYQLVLTTLKCLYTTNVQQLTKDERKRLMHQMQESYKSLQFQLGFTQTQNSPQEYLIFLINKVQKEEISESFKKILLQFAHSIQANSNVILKIQSIQITKKITDLELSKPAKNKDKTQKIVETSTVSLVRELSYEKNYTTEKENRINSLIQIKSQSSCYKDYDFKAVLRGKRRRIKIDEVRELDNSLRPTPVKEKGQLKSLQQPIITPKKQGQRYHLRQSVEITPQKYAKHLESSLGQSLSKVKTKKVSPQTYSNEKNKDKVTQKKQRENSKCMSRIQQAKSQLQLKQRQKPQRTLYSIRSLKIIPKKLAQIPSTVQSLSSDPQYDDAFSNQLKSNVATRTNSAFFEAREIEVLVEETPRPKKKVKIIQPRKMLKQIIF